MGRDEAARAAARKLYGSDDVEIDVDATVTRLDEPGPTEGDAWVQAWVYVTADEIAKAAA